MLLLWLCIGTFCTAQKVKPAKQLLRLSERVANVVGGSVVPSGDDADRIAQGLQEAADTHILYLPAGTYHLKKGVQLYRSGLHIKGDGMGKTIVIIDSAFIDSGQLFEANGASDITIEGISFSGMSKRLKSVLSFNSYPNRNRRIHILHCEFANLWVDNVINFGGTAAGETHSTDEVMIDDCHFRNIFNPAYPVVWNDTDPRCNAINLQQTTLRANIQNCSFTHISGDGIFGWGWSQNPKKVNPLYGKWNIHHNNFNGCWMCIEINGNGLGSGLNIHHNTFRCSTHDGGFLVSVDGYGAAIQHNDFYNVDRSLVEYTAIGGVISDNKGVIVTYSDSSGGVPASVPLKRVACLELYGYNNRIENNNFTLQPASFYPTSPKEFNGIKLIGKTTDPQTQPISYRGISDYPAFWIIRYNSIKGVTHKLIDATNEKIRNVDVRYNYFSLCTSANPAVEVYGYNWRISDNVFEVNDAAGTSEKNLVQVFYLQHDNPEMVIKHNTVLSSSPKRACQQKPLF